MKMQSDMIKFLFTDIKKFGLRYMLLKMLERCGFNTEEQLLHIKANKYQAFTKEQITTELEELWYRQVGKLIDLNNPNSLKTFNEKIQWVKLFGTTQQMTDLSDKYKVRNWVSTKIGEDYLVPILGVWNCAEDINFDSLPNSFVLKANHGSGWNIIVKDKLKMNKSEVKKKLNKWLNMNFAYYARFEMEYSRISPCIIAEKYLENGPGELYDYKFWCFNGKVEFIMFLSNRQNGLQMINMNTNWEPLEFTYNYPKATWIPDKPNNLDEMISIAEILSKDFPHVRVDLYRLNDGSIKFGEMTFTSATGFQAWNPEKYNDYFGNLLDISKYE